MSLVVKEEHPQTHIRTIYNLDDAFRVHHVIIPFIGYIWLLHLFQLSSVCLFVHYAFCDERLEIS